MTDLSGNGNHFTTGEDNKPGYQVGIDLPADSLGGPYKTDLPLIGLDQFVNARPHLEGVVGRHQAGHGD